MKIIKIYLVVATLMLIAALGTGVYVWYMYQSLPQVPTDVTPVSGTQNEPDAASGATSTSGGAQKQAPIVIDATKLTDAQRSMLETFGYTGDSITVTEAALACAKREVGEARFLEILNGSAPGPLEAMKLLPCMKQ